MHRPPQDYNTLLSSIKLITSAELYNNHSCHLDDIFLLLNHLIPLIVILGRPFYSTHRSIVFLGGGLIKDSTFSLGV